MGGSDRCSSGAGRAGGREGAAVKKPESEFSSESDAPLPDVVRQGGVPDSSDSKPFSNCIHEREKPGKG